MLVQFLLSKGNQLNSVKGRCRKTDTISMLILATILLTCVEGSVSINSQCGTRLGGRVECYMFELPTSIPRTTMELDSSCRNSIDYLSCALNSLEECGESGDEEAVFLRRVKTYLEERACHPSSPIYKALVNNLQCLNSSFAKMERFCSFPSGRRSRMVTAFEGYIFQNYGPRNPDNSECLNTLFNTACVSNTLGELCGEAVGDGILDLATYMFLHKCPEDLVSHLPHIVSTVHSAAEAEEEVEKGIKKK